MTSAHPSPASASSSTLFATTPLPSNSDSNSKESLTLPQFIQRPTTTTKALRPSSLSISLPLSSSSPPPQRMSGKGFVEPHRSHLPRRANTTKSRAGSVRAETMTPPPRKAVEQPPPKDEDEDPLVASNTGRRHSGSVNPTSANANNGHMPTQLLSLRISEPSALRTITPTLSSSVPQTPPLLPPRTPQQTPPPSSPPPPPGTPAQAPKGHLEPQSANLPRRHQRSAKVPERDGSPVSKVRHTRSGSGARLGARDEMNGNSVEEKEGLWRDALGEERRTRSASRYSGERSRSGSPPSLARKDTVEEEEHVPLNFNEHSKACLQEMGRDSGVFVGFLPNDINIEEEDEDSQEPLHVVVQSNTDRLVLPLPPLPPPIEAPCPSELWSSGSCGAEQSRTTYLDGVTVLTDAQIQDGCKFIERARHTVTTPESARVWILSPRLRPEEAMSLAICYLAYSSSPPALRLNPAPPPSVSSKALPIQSQSSSDADSNSSESLSTPVVVIPSGSANLNLTQEQMIRTRKLSFPGSWDDDELVDFVEHRINVDSSIPAKFKEPRYTPAHALYMHLHDDIDGDVDLERELWDAAEEREAFVGGGGGGGTGTGVVGGQIGSGGELEEGMGRSEAASTTKSVFAGARGGHHRRRSRDLGSDDREREREGEQTRERGGTEYKCMRPEWRGVLSFEGLRRLDGVWLGGLGSSS